MRAYRHPNAGFTLPLPDDWETVEDTEGVALVALEPPRDGPWFRTNLVVTIEQLAGPPDLTAWQEQALGLMRQSLHEFQLIDVEEIELAGHPGRRTLAHHRSVTPAMVAAVAMEQWSLVVGTLGYTVTTSVGALEYVELGDLFAQLVAEFRPDPEFAQ